MRVEMRPGSAPGSRRRRPATGGTARGDTADVTLEYRFSGVAPGEGVPLSFLRFGEARLSALRVAGVRVTPPAAPGLRTTLEVPAGADRPAGAGARDPGGGYDAESASAGTVGPRAGLALRYRVARPIARDGASLRVHVPVLSVPWPPAEARPGTFHAEVRVPPDWKVTQVFPTGLRASAADPELLVGDLPVVPSVITVRAREGSGGLPTLPVVLDVLAALALAVVSWTGWRHLRSRT